MTGLIKQLEAATEGSRGLDYLIHTKLGWVDQDQGGWDGPNGEHTGEGWPYYTTSLDAALTLVPEGLRWTLRYDPTRKLNYWTWVWTDDGPCEAYKPTPALALCIAILKARSPKRDTS